MVADVVFIFLSVWLAFFLKFDYAVPAQYLDSIWKLSILSVIFVIPVLYLHGLYTFSWSYVSTKEIVALVKALTLSFVFMAIVIFTSKDFHNFIGFPRSILLITYFLIFIFSGGIRLSKKVYLSFFHGVGFRGGEKTLIVGAGDTGEQVVRSIFASSISPYFPIGFVDDNQIKQNVTIHGVKVLGKISDIPNIIKEHEVTQLVIALPSAGSKTVKDAVELGKKAGIKKIKIFPPLSEIIKGNVSWQDIMSVKAEDLLGRDSVSVNTNQIEDLIKGKTILITGSAGSIGSELSRQVARFSSSRMVLVDQDETGIFNIAEELKYGFEQVKMASIVADVCDQEKIDAIFKKYQPQIVFHAAAYKHVPLMEENPDEAIKNNIFGTDILAKASVVHGVKKFIFISTDKAINPTSVMGATKRFGEMICQAYNSRSQSDRGSSAESGQKKVTEFMSVRFGNVLDSRGSVIPSFRQQIKRGGPVEVTHPDMKRYFMLKSEACLLVLQAASMGKGGEVFVLDMGKPVKILDLAKEMIHLSGFELGKDMQIIFTKPRPGEKLFEEMLTAEEGISVTQNQKIFIAKISYQDSEIFLQNIETFKNILINKDKYDLIEALKSMVPSYGP